MTGQKVMSKIMAELDRAEMKHPIWPEDLLRQTLIVTEEMGEVEKAVLSFTEFREKPYAVGDPNHNEEWLRRDGEITEEMVHVAAMAVRFLLNREK